jgi:hypothetical protein
VFFQNTQLDKEKISGISDANSLLDEGNMLI